MKKITKKVQKKSEGLTKKKKKGSFILLSAILFLTSIAFLRWGYRFLSFLSFVGAVASIMCVTPFSFSYIPAMLSVVFSVIATVLDAIAFRLSAK